MQLEVDIYTCINPPAVSSVVPFFVSASANTTSGADAGWVAATSSPPCIPTLKGAPVQCCQKWTFVTTSFDAPCITGEVVLAFAMNKSSYPNNITFYSVMPVDTCKPDALVNIVNSNYHVQGGVYSDAGFSNNASVFSEGQRVYYMLDLKPVSNCNEFTVQILNVTACPKVTDAIGNVFPCINTTDPSVYPMYSRTAPVSSAASQMWQFRFESSHGCSSRAAMSWLSRILTASGDDIAVTIFWQFYMANSPSRARAPSCWQAAICNT